MAEGIRRKQIENEVCSQIAKAMQTSLKVMVDAMEASLNNRLPCNRKARYG